MAKNSQIYSLFYSKKHNFFWKFLNPSCAYLYFNNYRLNLLNKSKEQIGVEHLIQELEQTKIADCFPNPRVCHLFYEFTDSEYEGPLGIVIDYQKVEKIRPHKDDFPIKLKEAIKKIDYDTYKKSFIKIQDFLLRGDAYQVNLTYTFDYKLNEKLTSDMFERFFTSEKSHKSAYAHLTYLSTLNQMFLSNSPECLFGTKIFSKYVDLYTMPIKGSLKLNSVGNFASAWKKLKNSKKEQAELFMITDLLRNDLNRIDKPIAKVLHTKKPLKVVGILHQYSVIAVKLNKNISVWKILKSLFPGGSITGAPKLRVMEIIKSLESSPRQFYCGSTLLFFGKQKQASINIRSATIDFQTKLLTYGSGGGVTLLSECKKEFDEMRLKQKSFAFFLSNKNLT